MITDRHREGRELFYQGKFPDAIRAFEEALSERETSVLWNDWAVAKLAAGDGAEAERGYRRALQLDPHNRRAVDNLAAFLAERAR